MSNIRLETNRPIESINEPTGSKGASASTPVSLVPPPSTTVVSDDAVDAIAKLLAQMDENDRSMARKSEATNDQAQAREDASQVQAMHDKADDLRSEGFATGLTEIGAGVAAFCASVTPANDKVLAASFTGAQHGLDASGKIAGGQYKASEADDDATAKVHGSASAAFERASKRAHEDAEDARAELNKVLDWVKEMRSAQNGAMAAAASYRA